MCGIAGSTDPAQPVTEMLERIAHRGPDGSGTWQDSTTTVGHVRLALLDLTDAGQQPFHHGESVVCFNGEIWNWQDLRTPGVTYRTSCDTEVLAEQLDRRGLECLRDLDGMFAFSWTHRGETWLVRDRHGKVPLYAAKTRGGYTWSSERKGFPPGVQPIAIPAGYAFNVTSDTWHVWYRQDDIQADPIGASQVRDLIASGVQKRLQADAPVCCLLSGGLDSTLICAIAAGHADVTAYTAVHDPHSDDLKFARIAAKELGVHLVEVPIVLDDSSIDEACRSIEIASKAQLEIAMLCIPLARKMAQDGFKACLSGEAADELFGGYGNFCIQAAREPHRVRELRLEQLGKMSRGNFVRCNKVFMSQGVECRLPFMEQDLVDACMSMDLKASPIGKKLLKRAAGDLVPKRVINRPKHTFQGGSGVSDYFKARLASPVAYYNSRLRDLFGYIPRG